MLPDHRSKPNQERQATAALQAFFSISKRWQLNASQERVLLGTPPESTFFSWKKQRAAKRLSRDTLERISYILGIYKDLHILLPSAHAADMWVKTPNHASLFCGKSALERMLGGNVTDLAAVRQYLDAQRG